MSQRFFDSLLFIQWFKQFFWTIFIFKNKYFYFRGVEFEECLLEARSQEYHTFKKFSLYVPLVIQHLGEPRRFLFFCNNNKMNSTLFAIIYCKHNSKLKQRIMEYKLRMNTEKMYMGTEEWRWRISCEPGDVQLEIYK